MQAMGAARAAGFALLLLAGCSPSEPETAGGPTVMRRLTQDQYRNVVADTFGPDIKVGGRFEPEMRDGGLLAVGAGKVSIPSAGLEQYAVMARGIADQVLDPARRAYFLSCAPADAAKPDEACAGEFLGQAGRLLYRRPLTGAELASLVAAAAEATRTLGDFHDGLEVALAGMLQSPSFLFVFDSTEVDPAAPGQRRLTAYAKASRLSLFLWNSGPDEALLASAESGALHGREELARQADRMLASPRMEAGLRAFFTDMLAFDGFASLAKDAAIYPKFTFDVAADAQEQTLRTAVDHLLVRNGDYRDLFTTRHTFLTRTLGSIAGVPIASTGWQEYDFPEGDPRAGILAQVSFVALHSHPGRSSPTLRGKALREVVLCQKVPDPPGNVNFNLVQDIANPQFRTVRARLDAHASDPSCVGCHKVTDPIGLAMENFDSIGGYRKDENGAPIDTAGELDGAPFTDMAGLGRAVRDNPATPSCLVDRLYAYAVGRPAVKGEAEWLNDWLKPGFADDGYRIPALMKRIATSDAFFRLAPPAPRPAAQTADAGAPTQETHR